MIRIIVIIMLSIVVSLFGQSSRDRYQDMDWEEIGELDDSFYGDTTEKTEVDVPKREEDPKEASFIRLFFEGLTATISAVAFFVSVIILCYRAWRLRRDGASWGTVLQFFIDGLPAIPALLRRRHRLPGAIPVGAA